MKVLLFSSARDACDGHHELLLLVNPSDVASRKHHGTRRPTEVVVIVEPQAQSQSQPQAVDHTPTTPPPPLEVPLSLVLRALTARYPRLLAVLERSVVTVNLEYVDVDWTTDERAGVEEGAVPIPTSTTTTTMVRAGDEVAIIPPVSGG